MASVYDQYRQTSVQTASPEQLVLMLYDGAIRFLEQAKAALLEGKDATDSIYRAQEVILELLSSLNHGAGGDIADSLSRLYDFWLQWLMKAQAHRDVAKIEQVITMARELREAWQMIITQQKRMVVGAAPSASAAFNARG